MSCLPSAGRPRGVLVVPSWMQKHDAEDHRAPQTSPAEPKDVLVLLARRTLAPNPGASVARRPTTRALATERASFRIARARVPPPLRRLLWSPLGSPRSRSERSTSVGIAVAAAVQSAVVRRARSAPRTLLNARGKLSSVLDLSPLPRRSRCSSIPSCSRSRRGRAARRRAARLANGVDAPANSLGVDPTADADVAAPRPCLDRVRPTWRSCPQHLLSFLPLAARRHCWITFFARACSSAPSPPHARRRPPGRC